MATIQLKSINTCQNKPQMNEHSLKWCRYSKYHSNRVLSLKKNIFKDLKYYRNLDEISPWPTINTAIHAAESV